MADTLSVVQITWIDHHGRDGHASEETLARILKNIESPVVYRTTGVLIHENEREYVVAREERIDDDMEEHKYESYMVIQKPLVTKVVRYQEIR